VTRCRYVAFVSPFGTGRSDSMRRMAEHAARAGALQWLVDTSELIVLTDGTSPALVLDWGGGVVLGSLYQGAGSAALTSHQRDAIGETQGTFLLERCWGQYVALLRSPVRGDVTILRDPSGGLPCYQVSHRDGMIITSDPQCLADLGIYAPQIDWAAVAMHLMAPELRPATTCLTGMTEVLRGQRLILRSAGTTLDDAWTPWTYAAQDMQIAYQHEATSSLRAIVCDTISALSAGSGPILLGLSGGLDSSIVAAGLAASGRQFSCLGFATKDAGGDERHFARQVTDRLEVPFIEAYLDPVNAKVGGPAATYLPRPIGRYLTHEIDRLSIEAATEIGATAHWNGAGGDNVFCYLQSAAPIVDRWRQEGRIAAWATLRDVCIQTGCNISTAVRLARRINKRGPAYPWRAETDLLAQDMVESITLPEHPWLNAPEGASPGKAAHIASLMRIENHLEGMEREQTLAVISPLMAQPVVELCLRIPSWYWVQGGRDRSVARDAFSGLLPDPVLARRTKGTPDSFSATLFEKKRTEFRALLMDGLLRQKGLLDLPSLDKLLAFEGPVAGLSYLRVLTFAQVELWARHWARKTDFTEPGATADKGVRQS